MQAEAAVAKVAVRMPEIIEEHAITKEKIKGADGPGAAVRFLSPKDD